MSTHQNKNILPRLPYGRHSQREQGQGTAPRGAAANAVMCITTKHEEAKPSVSICESKIETEGDFFSRNAHSIAPDFKSVLGNSSKLEMMLVFGYHINEVINMKDKLLDKQSAGCYQNLENQIHSIMKHAHEGSIKTRYRYEAATERFCTFLANEFKLQKFENVKTRHIVSYVEYLKKEGKSASTIKTDLSAIRYFHRLSGSKNQLIDNSKLDLEQRQFAKVDRSILPHELDALKQVCKELARLEIYHAVDLSSTLGLRLNEVASLRLQALKSANFVGSELHIKGKGGRDRYIPIRNEEQARAVQEAIDYAESKGCHLSDYVISDRHKGGVQKAKRSIQNFINSKQHLFVDPNRASVNDTQKIKQNHISFHSLRYYYCNTLYQDLTKNPQEKYSKSEARKYCSEALGHGRESVTLIYLK